MEKRKPGGVNSIRLSFFSAPLASIQLKRSHQLKGRNIDLKQLPGVNILHFISPHHFPQSGMQVAPGYILVRLVWLQYGLTTNNAFPFDLPHYAI
jgi:hypothetical protein